MTPRRPTSPFSIGASDGENRDMVLPGRLTYSAATPNLRRPCLVNPGGNLELLRMLRRLTAVVIIWVSLLGMAFPAFACSLAASTGDCCGQARASSPCAGGEGFLQLPDATTALCCASAAFPSVAIDSSRASHERAHHPSSPDPFVLIAWWASWSAPVPVRLVTPSLIRSQASTAALTYLYTARLRL
jgi:hypothetical protein